MLRRQQDIDIVFRALANPLRVRILQLLRGRTLEIEEIVDILRMPRRAASAHLVFLCRAGLVKKSKVGARRCYSLRQPRQLLHKKLLDCIVTCSSDVPSIHADATRAARLSGPRPDFNCC